MTTKEDENTELETDGSMAKRIILETIKQDIDEWKMVTIIANRNSKIDTVILSRIKEDWKFEDFE